MFERALTHRLADWSARDNRKPLVLRGARQVGKTTLVNMFSRNYDQYIYLNLEKERDRRFFTLYKEFDDLLQALFLARKMLRPGRKTLIFIDEIQESPEAIRQLRYFYEQAPDIHVISAGSRLAVALKTTYGFPVGRVEYLTLHPVTFPEFLNATGEHQALNHLTQIPVPEYAHDQLLSLFHTYTLIGGMPEIVGQYASFRDLTRLQPIYESLLSSFLEDAEHYVRSKNQAQLIRHAVMSIFAEAGKRIKFEGFGQSNYRSREMGETLRKLERAFLINLIYPTTQVAIPGSPDKRKSPKLQVLDTGLLNYFNGLQVDLISIDDLNKIYLGKIAEHIVGQELLALQTSSLAKISFWVREKKESQAELDFTFPYTGKIIPLEVKSGSAGKLKSLHIFMDMAPHDKAVRLYPGKITRDELKTNSGKPFTLLNLPYYLVSQIENYLSWAFHD